MENKNPNTRPILNHRKKKKIFTQPYDGKSIEETDRKTSRPISNVQNYNYNSHTRKESILTKYPNLPERKCGKLIERATKYIVSIKINLINNKHIKQLI